MDGDDRFRRCVGLYADKLDAVRPGLGKAIRSHPGTVRKTSRRRLVIGAGSGSTGTSSLTTALTQLGLTVAHDHQTPIPKNEYCPFWGHMRYTLFTEASKCIPYLREFDFTDVPKGIDAVVDTPYTELFVDLFLAFPRARFILTDRPKEEWAKKRMRFAGGITSMPVQEPCGMTVERDQPLDQFAELFTINNDFVRCVVPRGRLFELDVFQNRTPDLLMGLARFLRVRPPRGHRHKGLAFPHERSDGFGGQYHYESCFSQDLTNMLHAQAMKESLTWSSRYKE